MEIHVIGGKIPARKAEGVQSSLVPKEEVEPEEVQSSSLRSISQYDSDDGEGAKQGKTNVGLPQELETSSGGELPQERVKTEDELPQGEEDELPQGEENELPQGDEDDDDQEEGDGADVKLPAARSPTRKERLKRNRNQASNSFNVLEFIDDDYDSYTGNLPSPRTEVSSSESDDEYRPNSVKPKATPNKSPEKKSNVKLKVEDEAAAEETVKTEKFQCQDCGATFGYVFNLARHVQAEVCKRDLKCRICSQLFTDSRSLKQHVQMHLLEGEEAESFKCCKCNMVFCREDALKRHMTKSHPNKITEKGMDRSINDVHDKSSGKSSSPPLKKTRSHPEEDTGKPIQRSTKDVCEKSSPKSSSSPPRKSLRRCRSKVKYQISSSSESEEESRPASPVKVKEEALDEGEEFPVVDGPTSSKNEVLGQPSKTFVGGPLPLEVEETLEESASVTNGMQHPTQFIALKRVKREFTSNLPKVYKTTGTVGPRRFKCEFCGKCCKDNYSLQAHRRVHTGEQPFECPICKERFSRKIRLRGHLRKKHETTLEAATGESEKESNGRFKCIECDRTYSYQVNLSRHMKKHHSNWDGWQLPSSQEVLQNTHLNMNIKQEQCPSSTQEDQEDYSDILDYLRFSDDEESERFLSHCQNNGTSSFLSTSKQYGSSAFVKSAHFSSFDDDDVMPLILPYLRKLKRKKTKLLAENMIRLEVNGAEGEDENLIVEINTHLLSCFAPTIPVGTSSSVQTAQKFRKTNRCVGGVTENINDRIKNNFTPDPVQTKSSPKFRRHTEGIALVCSICNRQFSNNQNLTNHMRIHTGEKPYVCPVCDMRFMWCSALHQHQKRNHFSQSPQEKPSGFSVCHKQFTQSTKPMRLHKGDKPYSCVVCNKRFISHSTLYQHKKKRNHYEHNVPVKTRTDETKRFECSVCHRRFAYNQNLQKHKAINHKETVPIKTSTSRSEERFDCSVCNKRFLRNQTLQKHMRLHTAEKPKPYKCSVCSRRFPCNYSLKNHKRRNHFRQNIPATARTGTGDLEKSFECSKCSRRFRQNRSLQIHMRTHTGEKPYVCQVPGCDMRFANSSAFWRHKKKRNHFRPNVPANPQPSEIEKPFECSVCNRRYTENYKLKAHMRTHTGEKPYVCPVQGCDMRFTNSSGLLRHKRKGNHFRPNVPATTQPSEIEKPLIECSVCNRRYTDNYKLKAHMRTHTGEKPYVCPVQGCDMRFTNSSGLLRHKRRRNHFRANAPLTTQPSVIEKPFECSVCSRRFSENYTLKNHMRMHTGEKPYVCPFTECDMRFPNASALLRHKKKLHSNA